MTFHSGTPIFPDVTTDDVFRLETQRLWLRWPRSADAAAITSFASLAVTAQMTAAIPHPYPAGEAERFIFQSRVDNADGRGLVLVVTRKRSPSQAIGVVSATLSDQGEIELGYIFAPAVWGNGFACEAANAVIDTVFNLTRADAIVANSRVINGASRRVLEKCGFAYMDTGLDLMPARGGMHPCDRFAMSREAWSKKRAGKSMPPMMHQVSDTFGAGIGEARLPI